MRQAKCQAFVRFWKSNELKQVEMTVANLTQKVTGVEQSGEIAKNSNALKDIIRVVNEMRTQFQTECTSSNAAETQSYFTVRRP